MRIEITRENKTTWVATYVGGKFDGAANRFASRAKAIRWALREQWHNPAPIKVVIYKDN